MSYTTRLWFTKKKMKVFFIVKINKMFKSSKKDINVYYIELHSMTCFMMVKKRCRSSVSHVFTCIPAKVKALQGGHVKVAPRTVN